MSFNRPPMLRRSEFNGQFVNRGTNNGLVRTEESELGHDGTVIQGCSSM